MGAGGSTLHPEPRDVLRGEKPVPENRGRVGEVLEETGGSFFGGADRTLRPGQRRDASPASRGGGPMSTRMDRTVERSLPSNVEAERSVLGAIMLDPKA